MARENQSWGYQRIQASCKGTRDPTELEIDGPVRALADLIVDATNSRAANLQYLLEKLARHGIAMH
jgi:hypothetical protein